METGFTCKSKNLPQVCTLKSELNPKKFYWIIVQFEKNNFLLPKGPQRLAKFIEGINNKFKGKMPDKKDYLPKIKCSDFTEYFCSMAKKSSTNLKSYITPELINSIIEASKYWTNFPEAKFSKEELAVIQLARICQLHCTILLQKDVAPGSNSPYTKSTITFNSITKKYGKVMYKY